MSITIGGDAGQGVESSGAGFCRALARGGYYVFGVSDYRSRIRGGHNFYQVRASSFRTYAHHDPPHILLALTEESIDVHVDRIAEKGAVIYDDGFRVNPEEIERHGVSALPVPLTKIAEEHGNKLMMNTGALGAAAGVLGYSLKPLEEVIRDNFAKKGDKVVEGNLKVLHEARDYAREHYTERFPYRIAESLPDQPERMVLNGNEACSLGAVAGGCRFIAAYPMTPGTTFIEWMARHAEQTGVVTKHAEDEIAAVCMTIGAAHVGARSMTATSGGGFALMVEGLGMAGMVEEPIVIVEAQRGGPSTGLPTRTEQADLLFVLHASQGDFPRIVISPGNLEEYYEAGYRAFNLAEKYQCPVIVLSDQFLASSVRTIEFDRLRYEDVEIDRGAFLTDEELGKLEDERYLRHAFTESGISPRAIPGHPNAVYAISTDEHDEEGHITEDIENRRKMMRKRMKKLDPALKEMRGPTSYGPDTAEITLITWGSTFGPATEAVDLVNRDGDLTINLLQFSDIWPFPVEAVLKALEKTKRTIAVEQNYTGQFARFLRMCTGHEVNSVILKYDGRPFAPQEIQRRIEQEVLVNA